MLSWNHLLWLLLLGWWCGHSKESQTEDDEPAWAGRELMNWPWSMFLLKISDLTFFYWPTEAAVVNCDHARCHIRSVTLWVYTHYRLIIHHNVQASLWYGSQPRHCIYIRFIQFLNCIKREGSLWLIIQKSYLQQRIDSDQRYCGPDLLLLLSHSLDWSTDYQRWVQGGKTQRCSSHGCLL